MSQLLNPAKMRQRLTVMVHMPRYALYSLLLGVMGLLFGLDTGCIGPITIMPQFVAFFGELSATVHGLVVSSILIPAAVTSFFAGSVSDALGRPRTAGIGAFGFGLGTALEAGAQNLAMLFVGRIVTGIGEGLFISTITVYICEIAPSKERGMLCSIQQFFISFGICAGYFICYGTVRSDEASSLAWRLPFAIQSFVAFSCSAVALSILPQSPRWLEAKHRYEEANHIWNTLGISSVEREKNARQSDADTASLTEALALTPSSPPLPNKKTSALAMFHRSVLSRTLLGASLMTFQQLSGIDGVLYYAPLLFQAAGLSSSTASFLASGVSALLMFLVTIPAFIYADRWGRRTSAITGGAIITTSMLLIGILYAAGVVHADYGAGRWAVITLIYIFALGFSVTWAIGLRVYVSEIQPAATRAPATSLAQSANWVTNWAVAFTTPILLNRATYSPYFLFGGCSLVAVVTCVLAMPETKGKTLEEINRAFERRSAERVLNVTGLTRRLARRKIATRSVSDDFAGPSQSSARTAATSSIGLQTMNRAIAGS